MPYLTPISKSQFSDWANQLEEAGIPYEESGFEIHTSQEGFQLIMGTPATPPPLESRKVRSKSKAKKERLTPWQNILFFSVVFALLGWFITSTLSEEEPPAPLTFEERHERDFGYLTDFYMDFTYWVQQEYLNYPNSYRNLDYNIISVEPDSVIVVNLFEAKNAFGMPQNHSITVVADMQGDIVRVVSFE